MDQEIVYEQEGQAGSFDLLIAGGMAIGLLIVIMVIMSVVGLQTWSVGQAIVDVNLTTPASDGLGGTVTDENYLSFKQEAFSSINSGFEGYGTLGDFVPIIVIVAVAALVLALLGGFGRGVGGGGGMGL